MAEQANTANGCWCVVPASGVGKRMGGTLPKQYLSLDNAGSANTTTTVIECTLRRLAAHPDIRGIVVVIAEEHEQWPALSLQINKPLIVAAGGKERCDSVLNGLHQLQFVTHNTEVPDVQEVQTDDWVLVHDAARPCIRHSDISRLMAAVRGHAGGGLLGLPMTDTVKRCDAVGIVQQTIERNNLWRALTPQMFPLRRLTDALTAAFDGGHAVTDEASAMELFGYQPLMVEGHSDNIKITHPQDLALANHYLEQQEHE
ncbi:MAG: 2-C-methyl-D-erythritol 4-phosphate cytidylyltransferase [Gammaproteobacteria bacterium]|nr:2-C-methyl-D-erythritol 4-phosphate cytidylyltransferase [Gammaproteobacteria bacterium]